MLGSGTGIRRSIYLGELYGRETAEVDHQAQDDPEQHLRAEGQVLGIFDGYARM